jgi:hypothetical protein
MTVAAAAVVTNTLLVPGTQLFQFVPMVASVVGVGSDGQTGFEVLASAPGKSTSFEGEHRRKLC